MKRKGERKPPAAEDLAVRFGAREREFMYGVAMRYMKDAEDAADVAQEALLLAWRYRASFKGNSRFTTWLYRIAATTALMALRKRRKKPFMFSITETVDDQPVVELPDPAPSLENTAAARELVALMVAELGKFDNQAHARGFFLKFVEGLEEKRVGELLEVNAATAKTHIYRGLAQIRSILRGHLSGGTPDEADDE